MTEEYKLFVIYYKIPNSSINNHVGVGIGKNKEEAWKNFSEDYGLTDYPWLKGVGAKFLRADEITKLGGFKVIVEPLEQKVLTRRPFF